MSLLTKVFVVLVSLLSVLMVAVTVPFAANTQDYQSQLEQATLEARSNQQRARAANSLVATVQQQSTAQVLRAEAARRAAENEADKQFARAEGLAQENIQLRAQVAVQQANNTELTAANTLAQRLLDALFVEVEDRREKMVEMSGQILALTDRIDELASQNESMQTHVRLLQQQNEALRQRERDLAEELVKFQPRGEAAPTQVGPTITEQPLRGRVTHVQADQPGVRLAQVNIGRVDGVQENMVLMVHRGERFLANIRITTVDDNAAAGELQLVQEPVQVGDGVSSAAK